MDEEQIHESALERAAVGEEEAKPPPPSDAILTIPNLITFARLALIPVFIWLGLGDNVAAAWVVGFVAGSTDFVDGKIARRLGQVSKLGIAMDPLSDRLLVFAFAWIALVKNFTPADWTIWVVVARDAALLASLPFIATLGIERPAVSWFGKAGTMGIMGGFGFFMAAHIHLDAYEPIRFTLPPNRLLTLIGWLCYVPGLLFSYIAAAGYVRDVVKAPRNKGHQ